MLLVLAITTLPNLLGTALTIARGERTFLFTATTEMFVKSLAMQAIAALVLVPILVARGWRPGLTTSFPGARDLLPALALWIGALVTAGAVHLVVRRLNGGHAPIPFRLSITAIPIAALAMAVLDPVYEEILWLGYWFRRLEAHGPALAISVSVLLRTVAHAYQGVTALISILPLALIWTFYFKRTGRLWPIILAHVAQDTMATILLLTGH